MIILGAGGHCAEVLRVLGEVPVRVVVDTEEHLEAARGAPDRRNEAVLAASIPWGQRVGAEHDGFWGDKAFIAIGDPRSKRAVYDRHCDRIATFVAIAASMGMRLVTDPPGGYVGRYGYVDATAKISRHVHVNRGAMVAHDCVVGEFSHIAPGAQVLGGGVVGALCEVGANAVILPKRRLADGCRLGAGAVLTRDWDRPNSILRGNPARFVEEVKS